MRDTAALAHPHVPKLFMPSRSSQQGSVVMELQSELGARTAHCISLQSELQALQFHVQQINTQADGVSEAEQRERDRWVSKEGRGE